MKKKSKILLVFAIISIILIPTVYFLSQNIDPFFTSGGRYDDSALTDMENPYVSPTDLYGYFEGYSTTTSCPWGFLHNGIDYFFDNSSIIISAAPGKVILIELRDNGVGETNRYTVLIQIRFSKTIVLEYNFESWTSNIADRVHQRNLFNVDVGDWVEQGDEFAKFLNIASSAHVHFGVKDRGKWSDPTLYFSDTAETNLIGVMQTYHPTWTQISYT